MFLEKLLKLSNPQITVFDWKWSQLKKVQSMSVSYQYIVIKVPTNWAKLPTNPGTLDLLTYLNLFFRRIIKIIKSTNNSVWLKMKPTQKCTNIVSQLPLYGDKGANKLG